MLQTGLPAKLPEKKDYLDAILTESIICHIPEKSRKWITNINKFELDKNLRKKYDKILSKNLSSEQLYQNLSKLLYDNFDYINCFKEILDKIGKMNNNRRALIYARSKREADNISNRLNNVSRYPNLTKTHVVASDSEATYGLNNLVIYNTIICYPNAPDLIPQKKGRLDRPNQKSDILYMEYVLTKNTIEEAWLFKLEMANNFYKHHIMPLAEFYDLAVGKIKVN